MREEQPSPWAGPSLSFLQSLGCGGGRPDRKARWLPRAPLARLSSGDVAWGVTVVHFLLVISSSMWRVGLLPASDEDTRVNTHTL